MREYDFNELTYAEEPIDGISGATIDELVDYAIDKAVYTVYTIWHLVHNGEKAQLIELTVNQININSLLINRLIQSDELENLYFTMDLLKSGMIKPSLKTNDLLYQGLLSENIKYKSYAFRSLVFSDISSPELQLKMVKIYENSDMTEKLKIIKAFEGAKISQEFYEVLFKDMDTENQWFKERLTAVLGSNRTNYE